MSAIITISWILTAVLIGLVGWIAVKHFHERKDPTNPPIIHNYMSQYTGNHFEGIAKSIEYGHDRVFIQFAPRDLDYIGIENKDKKYQEYPLFVKKSHFKITNKSAHRQIIEVYPIKSEDIPMVSETQETKRIEKTIESSQQKEEEMHILRKKSNAQDKFLRDNVGQNIAMASLELLFEQNKLLKDKITEQKPPTPEAK